MGRRAAESARRHLTGGTCAKGRESPRPRRCSGRWRSTRPSDRAGSAAGHAAALQRTALRGGCAPGGRALPRLRVRLCVDDCEFLAKHCDSPKELARRVADGLDDGRRPGDGLLVQPLLALRQRSARRISTRGSCSLEARRRAVGAGPRSADPQHKPHPGGLRTRRLPPLSAWSCRSRDARRSKRLFFTGCALPARRRGRHSDLYDELRGALPGHRRADVLLRRAGRPPWGMEDRVRRDAGTDPPPDGERRRRGTGHRLSRLQPSR